MATRHFLNGDRVQLWGFPVITIKDWDSHYETNETRKLKRLLWVKLPNQHDSLPYRTIASHPRGPEIFAAWILMVQVASKQGQRGNLPMSPEELGLVTGFPAEIFKLAFEVLKSPKIGWIEHNSTNLPESPDVPGFPPENLPAEEGREGKGKKEWKTGLGFFQDGKFQESWKAWEKARNKKAGERQYRLLEKLSAGNLETAIAILNKSADNQWAGIFELKTNQPFVKKQEKKKGEHVENLTL